MSHSYTTSTTFTRTSAKHLASRVAGDLRQFQLFYDEPSDEMIQQYQDELVELLVNDCLENVTYGYRKNGSWIMAIEYKVINGTLTDSRSGGIYAGADVSGAYFGSCLEKKTRWYLLTSDQRTAIQNALPFERVSGNMLGYEGGYWESDKSYFSDGQGLSRKTYRPL